MNAKVITNETPGGERAILGDILPLDTPKLVQLFPVYACNFRCEYCFHALSKEQRGYDCDTVYMEFDLFKKSIDDMGAFPAKIKMLRIAGLGEPLMHKNIAEMVDYAKMSEKFRNVNIVTNAFLLNDELSLKLIKAKLDMLRISIQGISAQQYKEIADVKINFEKFVDNIRFFFEHRSETKVYIKIIDCALKTEEDKNKFFEIFGDICDLISIEYMTPTVEGIDYDKLSERIDSSYTQSGNSLSDTKICPMPYYMIQINPDGYAIPCCGWQIPIRLGNIKETSIVDIWNCQDYSGFRERMLTGAVNCGKVCAACTLYRYGSFPEDNLDSYVEKLLPIYKHKF